LFNPPAATRATTSRSRALSDLKLSCKVKFDCSFARRASSRFSAVETASRRYPGCGRAW
jgi:hypothetical protein